MNSRMSSSSAFASQRTASPDRFVLFFLPLTLGLAVVVITKRDRIDSWFLAYPAMRAGLLGAAAATALGAVANDSGALLLEIGIAYLPVFIGFAWSVGTEGGPEAS